MRKIVSKTIKKGWCLEPRRTTNRPANATKKNKRVSLLCRWISVAWNFQHWPKKVRRLIFTDFSYTPNHIRPILFGVRCSIACPWNDTHSGISIQIDLYQRRCDGRFPFVCASNNYIALAVFVLKMNCGANIFWLDHFERKDLEIGWCQNPFVSHSQQDCRKLAHFSFGFQFNWISDCISFWYDFVRLLPAAIWQFWFSICECAWKKKKHSHTYSKDWRFCFVSQVSQIETMDANCVSASFDAFKTAGQVIPFPLHIFPCNECS